MHCRRRNRAARFAEHFLLAVEIEFLSTYAAPRVGMASTAQAYIIFHCSSRELQARAGFDGWVMLLRDDFDTEDQAWQQEKMRLASIAKRKMQRLEAGGVELDMLQLVPSCHLLLDPPNSNREEERIWCIEFFNGKMYDSVADDRELVERLNSFQDELLQSARLHGAAARALQWKPMSREVDGEEECEDALSARPVPSGDDSISLPSSPDERQTRSGFSPADVSVGTGERKALSAAALAAALDLSDLDQAQQRYNSGGAFLPILPLGNDLDIYSFDRGPATFLPTSTTERWGS